MVLVLGMIGCGVVRQSVVPRPRDRTHEYAPGHAEVHVESAQLLLSESVRSIGSSSSSDVVHAHAHQFQPEPLALAPGTVDRGAGERARIERPRTKYNLIGGLWIGKGGGGMAVISVVSVVSAVVVRGGQWRE